MSPQVSGVGGGGHEVLSVRVMADIVGVDRKIQNATIKPRGERQARLLAVLQDVLVSS